MLVVIVIIQVSTVLLNTGINPKRCGIDLLCPQVEIFQLSVNLPLSVTVLVLDPDALDVCTFGDMVPVSVRSAAMLLRQGEEAGLVHSSGVEHGHFIPDSSSILCERLQGVLEVVEGFRPRVGYVLWCLEDLLDW